VTSLPAIVSATSYSSLEKAAVYVVVKQKLSDSFISTVKGKCANDVPCYKQVTSERKITRLLQIQLMMTWKDAKWLVSTAQINVISSPTGVLTAATGSGGTS
jgi:hypothetical protein